MVLNRPGFEKIPPFSRKKWLSFITITNQKSRKIYGYEYLRDYPPGRKAG
jgi:hypothetical protein